MQTVFLASVMALGGLIVDLGGFTDKVKKENFWFCRGSTVDLLHTISGFSWDYFHVPPDYLGKSSCHKIVGGSTWGIRY